MYLEHIPHSALSPYVECYWTLQGYIDGKEVFKVLPDGCVDILFDMSQTPHAHIVGTMTSCLEVQYAGQVDMLGIRFHPTGITAFTRVPVNEFTNRHTNISLVETIFDKEFCDNMPLQSSLAQKIAYADSHLLGQLAKVFLPDTQIIHAVQLIKQSKGILLQSRLASQICLSPRQMECRFKSAIGISPKTFSKIIKFKHALRYLQNHPADSLYSVAVDCGYYDHAHLIKEFKSLSGDLPSHFRD